jgi:hypothetical protein
MISPEARERLASQMDDRRLELGLRWRDVAKAGGVSYEALRDVRKGTGGIRRLTAHAIETGLQWEPGSVTCILDGGEPVPADPSRPSAPATAIRAPSTFRATPAMERAMESHITGLKALVAEAQIRGAPLTGAEVLGELSSWASDWDDLTRLRWPLDRIIAGIAALMAMDEQAAEDRRKNSATGLISPRHHGRATAYSGTRG